jgi:exodeoxyribonuclease V beta subunit
VFEKLDFSADDDGIPALVAGQLQRHGFGAEWRQPVSAMVHTVIRSPLGIDDGPFCLADLPREDRLTELEFFFPLRFIEARKVSELLRNWGGRHAAAGLPELADRLDFVPVRGMLRGFLDMVFRYGGRYYLVDWKSNHLGNRPEEYGRDSLAGEMDRKLYRLQYLLYTVALNRFLAVRDPAYRYDSHFGGALYLFLRGLDPDLPGNGIFRDLPPAGLVEDLTACLMESGGGR